MKRFLIVLAALSWAEMAHADPLMTFDEFQDEVATRIHAQAPSETARPDGPSTLDVVGTPRGEMHLDLSGSYHQYQNDPSQLDAVVLRQVRIATTAVTHDSAHLTVLVEPNGEIQRSGLSMDHVSTRPLGGDLIEILAMNSPFDGDLIGDRELAEIGLTTDAAWTRAVANVANMALPQS